MARRLALRKHALWLLLLALATPPLLAEESARTMEADKHALATAQSFVGTWRGVGQPKRGSSQGAWSEITTWSWHFADGHASLLAHVSGNRHFAQLQLAPAADGALSLLLTPTTPTDQSPAPAARRFTAAWHNASLVAIADDEAGDDVARITIRLTAGGDRMTVLLERRVGPEHFLRIAEVGATREGSGFAKTARSGHECVVTGGQGKISVEHEGKTYWVCCGGCRDLFLEDPAGVLADYRARKAQEAAGPAK